MVFLTKNYKRLASGLKISSNIAKNCSNNEIFEGKLKNNSNKLIMRLLTITKVSIIMTVLIKKSQKQLQVNTITIKYGENFLEQ